MIQYAIATGDMQSPNLAHYGILRQKWGVRRFQYPDGRLTPAGKARYHKMIATNVQKDRVALARGDKRRTKYRSKIEKEIQEEFRQTPEGRRLEQANEKVGKIQRRMNTRDESYQDPKSGVMAKTVNRIGQNADKNRMADAIAEQNEAQKAGAKKLDEIRKEFSDDILDATIKDLKIYITDDGREFLEKYLRGDEDATFEKPSKKQERAEAKEVKEAKRQAAAEKEEAAYKAAVMKEYGIKSDEEYERFLAAVNENPDGYGINGQRWGLPRKYQNWDGSLTEEGRKKYLDNPKYIDKVKTKDGDTRYFYDKSELKAYNDGKSGATDKDLDNAFKKMRSTAKTGEELDARESAWDRARDEDKWDLSFLEAVQNSVILDKNDRKSLLTEYAKYLADPSDYWQNERYKLKEL